VSLKEDSFGIEQYLLRLGCYYRDCITGKIGEMDLRFIGKAKWYCHKVAKLKCPVEIRNDEMDTRSVLRNRSEGKE